MVTHPFGGVKEQTAGLYAQQLAEQGFITLAYDAAYQGESGGEPRLMEVPAQRLDDISCAIDFIRPASAGRPRANRVARHLRRRQLCAVQRPDRAAREGGGRRQHVQFGRTPQLYREGYEYYRTGRAQHPNSPNKYMFSSLPLQMAYFPFDQLDTISPRPLLVIAGSKADTLFWSREVYEKAKEPKELFLVDGATHIDMYDRPQFVGPAVEKLKAFFR